VSEMLRGNDELGRVLASLPWDRVVFTNASVEHTRRVLEALAVSGHFSRVFDVRSTGYIGKPDPRAYQIVLDALGLQGGDCILFDDSLPNLQAAARLGMLTVLVGSRDRTEGVRWAIERIENAADVAADILPGLSLIAG
jgi:putative hydrolase of the HAD superfamily